jgi:hypothetical protein
MTDDIPSKDDPLTMDASPAHRFVAGRTGIGKTSRLIATMAALHAENAPVWIDPKANNEDN